MERRPALRGNITNFWKATVEKSKKGLMNEQAIINQGSEGIPNIKLADARSAIDENCKN